MTSTTSFQIFHDAEDTELTQHKIDAETLNISIGSMADLISATDERLSDGRQTVKLVVTDPAETGSLGVSYMMTELIPHAINVAKVIGLTGLAGAAVSAPALSLIRQLGSKKVTSITKQAGTNQSVLRLRDEGIACRGSAAKLVTDPEIRDVLMNIVHAPLDEKESTMFKVLNEDGVEIIRPGGEKTEEIKPLPGGALLEKEESVEEVNVRFVQINFGGAEGWRIEYLGEKHIASLEDQLFIHQVQDRIASFTKEDLFVVDLGTTKTFTARNASTKYVITKVKRERPAEV